MAYKKTDKLIKYNNNFNKKNYDRISLMVPKGKKEIIQSAAQKSGKSVNAYINSAIDLMMNIGDSYGNSEAKTENNCVSRSILHTEPTEQNSPQYERSTAAELKIEKIYTKE